MKKLPIVLCLSATLLAVEKRGDAATMIQTQPTQPAAGEAFLVRVDGVEPRGNLDVRFGSRSFALWPAHGGGWEGLVAVNRDETAEQLNLFLVDVVGSDESLVTAFEVSRRARDYGVQGISVDESKVTLSPRDQDRVDRENATIRAVLMKRTELRLWRRGFLRPADGEVSGPFGVRRVYNGKPKGYHNGVDISAPAGAPVVAPAAARVAWVGDCFLMGWTVILDHGLGLHTAYFHMASVAVLEGETVEAGDAVGVVGSTGRSTGPHLHWGTYLAGLRVDPETLLRVTQLLRDDVYEGRFVRRGEPETGGTGK